MTKQRRPVHREPAAAVQYRRGSTGATGASGATLQRAPFVLGHPAPHAGVLAGLHRPLQARLDDVAAAADGLSLLYLYESRPSVPDREEKFRVLGQTGSLVTPIHLLRSPCKHGTGTYTAGGCVSKPQIGCADTCWSHSKKSSIRFTREALLDRKSTTSELQSRGHLVCRLLLEKKKKSPTILKHR